MVAPSTIPVDLAVLRNMGMVEREKEGVEPGEQDPADRQVDPPIGTPTLSIALPFVPRTTFERFLAQQMGDMYGFQRMHATQVDAQLAALETSNEEIRSEVHEMHQSYCVVRESTIGVVDLWLLVLFSLMIYAISVVFSLLFVFRPFMLFPFIFFK